MKGFYSMNNYNILEIDETLLIGNGRHKRVYLHPHTTTQCIKIAYKLPDPDIDRELKYRNLRNKNNNPATMLPNYYGTVPTTLGKGYVFERICDYDGNTSQTMYQFIESHPFTDEHIKTVQAMLLQFKELYFTEKILTYDMNPVNYLVQKLSPTKLTIKCIDDIGSSVLIPLELYICYFHDAKVQRYWKKLIVKLKNRYPQFMTREFIKQLE